MSGSDTRNASMRARAMPVLVACALSVLAACSPKPDREAAKAAPANDSPAAKANAEFARLQAQGPDATAREFTKTEYALTRSLMKAGGLDATLGGEAKADAALTALFMDYERKARALQSELPKAFAPVNEGGGGNRGGEGWGGAAASVVLGGSQASTAAQAWENGVDRGESSGHAESNATGDQVSVDWTPDSATMTTEVKADIDGLKGTVKTTVKLKTCPDPEGKVTVEFESVSSVAAGGGSANSTVKTTVDVFVDDDANLIDDKMDSESRAQQSTSSGSSVDASSTLSTSRDTVNNTVNGMGGASAEDGKMAQDMAGMGRYAAYSAVLMGAQKAWQSGKCVDLQVRSDPAKRKGAKPNTAYTLFAEPRAKSDGRPTGGTVKATLKGGNRLNPTGKVKADAKFDYANPDKKDQRASIDFESRSKRGVGKATLEFDTRKGGYRIVVGGGDPVNQVVCDIDKTFVLNGKLFGTEFSGGMDGTYRMVRTPNIPGLNWKASGTYHIDLPDGPGAPGTLSVRAREATTRAGRVSDNNAGYTDTFTMTPVEDCK